MERQMDGQAKHNRAPPTRWRGPKYILGHTDVLILRQKITITLTFIKTLGYRFHESRTTLNELS